VGDNRNNSASSNTDNAVVRPENCRDWKVCEQYTILKLYRTFCSLTIFTRFTYKKHLNTLDAYAGNMKRKAQGISINMIVVIAIAVFVVFLVLGFVSGGWQYFAGSFGSATKGTGGFEAAKIKCDTWCTSYQSSGCPTDGYARNRLYNTQFHGADTNNDGELNDCFSCLGVVNNADCSGDMIDNVIQNCACKRTDSGNNS